DKPIIVLRDYEVQLGGLPSSIPSWQIPFDTANLQAIKTDLSKKMQSFRSRIAEKKDKEFWDGVKRVALPAAVGFLVGAAVIGSSKK
ncbi:MAG TPA: hypothetical protein VIH03_00655, partial [Nitrososphaerales archaeon]